MLLPNCRSFDNNIYYLIVDLDHILSHSWAWTVKWNKMNYKSNPNEETQKSVSHTLTDTSLLLCHISCLLLRICWRISSETTKRSAKMGLIATISIQPQFFKKGWWKQIYRKTDLYFMQERLAEPKLEQLSWKMHGSLSSSYGRSFSG